MPRPRKTDRPVEKNISLPTSTVARVELELFSELEGRVPFGAWQKFLVGLIDEYFARKRVDTATGSAAAGPVAEQAVMRLWVLENVLADYTDGMVCVLARDEVEAWAVLEQKDSAAWSVLRGWPVEPDTRPLDELPLRFRCVDAPEAFVCWGGE